MQLRQLSEPNQQQREALAVYRYILQHDDPARVATVYMNIRHEGKRTRTHREVAEILKWEIKL